MRRLFAILLALVLVLGIAAPVTAADAQYQYSTKSNSGKRHELCTTLDGTSASSYYTGDYTFDLLSQQSGSTLLQSLRKLMKDTHKKKSSYADCRDMAEETDCENNDGRIVTIYTSYSATYSQYQSGNGWNREHVWPKSLGGFETSGAGADLHHIRPSENRTNSTRGNKKYGNVSGTKTVSGNLSGLVGGSYDSTYFEPLDNVKGDVARICLYVYVRYGGELSKCSSITNVFQSVDTLLEWCALDPVDTWEMGRNEVVEAYQGNRNVFIDYPEYAWLIFDREVPEDLVTPTSGSRNACGGNHSYGDWAIVKEATKKETGLRRRTCADCGKVEEEVIPKLSCDHSNTQLRGQKDPTCEEKGYTGDTYCTECDQLVKTGSSVPATGHSFGQWITVREATVREAGLRQRTCSACGRVEEETIPKLDCAHPSQELRNEKPAGCTTEGYSGDTYCTECDGLLSSGTAIAATGHNYGDWVTVNAPTVEETGLRRRTCSGCADVQEEVIPRLEAPCSHKNVTSRNEKEATCEEEGHTGDMYCADCGARIAGGSVIPALGHSYGDWTTVKEPTEAEEGLKQHSCGVCGKTEEEVLPKLEQQPAEPTQPVKPTGPAPTTPQDQEPAQKSNWIWICGLILAAAVAIAVLFKKKR